MSKILSIIQKDTRLRFSDRTELIFFLLLPIIFTFILSGGAMGRAETGIPLLVVDEDASLLSGELVSELESSAAVRVIRASREEAADKFANDEALAWLTIPQGFEATLLAGKPGTLALHKIPNDANADAAQRTVNSAVSRVSRSLAAARIALDESRKLTQMAPVLTTAEDEQEFFASSLAMARQSFDAVPARIVTTHPDTGSETSGYDMAAQASSGQLISWVFIPLLGASGLFAYERNQKTLPRLMTTPTSKATFLLGAISSQLLAAMAQMALLIGFGVFVLNVNWGRSPAGLAVILACFGLASVAMGVALGTFIKTEKQASNISIMVGMVMSLLGGCWWPIELFPQVMRSAAQALPTYWAMSGLTKLVMRGEGVTAILPIAAALLGFALVFFVIGVRRFRYE